MQCALLFALIVYRLIFLNGEGDRPIVIRPDLECGFIVFRSLLMMAPTCKELGEPVMRLEVPGIQPQRALEGVLRAQVIRDELEHIAPRDVSSGSSGASSTARSPQRSRRRKWRPPRGGADAEGAQGRPPFPPARRRTADRAQWRDEIAPPRRAAQLPSLYSEAGVRAGRNRTRRRFACRCA